MGRLVALASTTRVESSRSMVQSHGISSPKTTLLFKIATGDTMNNDAWFEMLQQQTDAEASDGIPDVEPGTSDVEAGPSDVDAGPSGVEAGPSDVEAGPSGVEAGVQDSLVWKLDHLVWKLDHLM